MSPEKIVKGLSAVPAGTLALTLSEIGPGEGPEQRRDDVSLGFY